MRKFFKPQLLVAATAILSASFMTSCSDDNGGADDLSAKEKSLQKVNIQFVSGTVVPTYKGLADKAVLLQEAVEALSTAKTNTNVSAACELWKSSRQYWEWSEAFLFGAASKYYIDPHIDTWPLDKTALENLLSSSKMMDDIENTIANLNNGLVGFHGLEYIIFREGKARAAADITEKELKYAIAVAKDLSISCCRLEAAWAGMDNVSAAKQDIIADAEMEPEDNFGEQMELAGFSGSTWKTVTLGSEQILEGCKTIVDEVANAKIGKPYTGEDEAYIESPHAYNSIQDFKDNIESVKYAYYGALGATSPQSVSISSYLESIDAAANQAVINAINNSIAKIEAMPKPFVKNYKDAKVGVAVDACNELYEKLEAARKAIVKN